MSPTESKLDDQVKIDDVAEEQVAGKDGVNWPHLANAAGAQAASVANRIKWQRRWARNVRATDTIVVFGAVALAQCLRFGGEMTSQSYSLYFFSALSVLFAATWLIALSALRTRAPRLIRAGIEEYRVVVAASFWTFGAIAIAALLLKLEVARGYLAIALPVGILGLLASRALWRQSVVRQRIRGDYQSAVLVVGDLDAAEHLAMELTCGPASGCQVVGLTIPGYGPPRGESIMTDGGSVPVLGDESHVMSAISACQADTVAIAGTEHFGVRGIRRLIWDLEPKGVDLIVSTGVMDVALSRLAMRPTAGLPVLHVDKPKYQGATRFQKRLFDVCFAAAALCVSAPMLILAAVAIKLTSRGSIFYAAERIGIEGQPFSMLKFRTMVDGADQKLESLLDANESDGLLFKMKDDPRITPVGRILRRFSIDEMPQFINVLRGQMSVVGPRPPLRREVDGYDCDVFRRLLVKPGVTGLWQVSGRSDLSWTESVRLDLSYVDNWSMIGDLLIIGKTVSAVFRRQGAY